MNAYNGDTATLVALLALAAFPLSFVAGEALHKLTVLPRNTREAIVRISLVVVASLSAFLGLYA